MPAIRGITVSVNYAPLLAITLVQNMRHLSSCLVITSPDDEDTKEVARSVPGVTVFETDAFTRPGIDGTKPLMNKGLAIEEGFDVLGREGLLLIWDADCLFPSEIPFEHIRPGFLHGCKRRILEDPTKWTPDLDWRMCQPSHDGSPVGFFQLFHADDPLLRDKRPWYDVTFAHAGGGDAYFITHWPREKQRMLPMEVLHLGPKDRHWFGTSQEAQDMMGRFVTENGWGRAARQFTPEQVARAAEPVNRVTVPGYPASTYELPFVVRSRKGS